MSRISQIELDDRNLPPPTPEIEQERKVAIFDLIEDNSFVLPKRDERDTPEGPIIRAVMAGSQAGKLDVPVGGKIVKVNGNDAEGEKPTLLKESAQMAAGARTPCAS